jgi:23S rRNA (uracil1939-C5)-methyltransferase
LAKRKKKTITGLSITGIADKGRAVGRTAEGQVIFVENAVPGDVVDVLVLRKKNNLSEAVVTQYQSYSKDRIPAACVHFGTCGGCKWQHLDYQKQLLYKEQTVRDAVSRIAKLNADIVKPILGCAQNLKYRNKLEYSFSTKRWITREEAASAEALEQQGALGFHRAGFFDKIVDIQECLLQDGLSNDIRNFIRQFCIDHVYSFYDLRTHEGLMRNIVVRNTTLGEWMVTIVFGKPDDERILGMMQAVQKQFPQITSLNYVVNEKLNDSIFDQRVINFYGKPYIVEKLRDVQYKIGTKSFFQTNPVQAVNLFDIACAYAELKPGDNVYDLYTGLGSIALYIADKVKHVTGIEEIPEAIEDANTNMIFNNIQNATFYAGDVKHLLNADFVEKHGTADVLITDPPRQGMHEEVVKTLLKLEVPRLVYISCNPATQARDLVLLKEKYNVDAIQPVDMFPHTHHIESVARLTLKQSL